MNFLIKDLCEMQKKNFSDNKRWTIIKMVLYYQCLVHSGEKDTKQGYRNIENKRIMYKQNGKREGEKVYCVTNK